MIKFSALQTNILTLIIGLITLSVSWLSAVDFVQVVPQTVVLVTAFFSIAVLLAGLLEFYAIAYGLSFFLVWLEYLYSYGESANLACLPFIVLFINYVRVGEWSIVLFQVKECYGQWHSGFVLTLFAVTWLFVSVQFAEYSYYLNAPSHFTLHPQFSFGILLVLLLLLKLTRLEGKKGKLLICAGTVLIVYSAFRSFSSKFWLKAFSDSTVWTGDPPFLQSALPQLLESPTRTGLIIGSLVVCYLLTHGAVKLARLLPFALLPGGLQIPFLLLVAPLLHGSPVSQSADRRLARGAAIVLACICSVTLLFMATASWKYIQGPVRPSGETLDSLPDSLKALLLMREDLRFHDHSGVDVAGMKWVVRDSLTNASFNRGASTISMQLAKLRYLSFDRTLSRKVMQILLAYILELRLSKDEILFDYLNRLDFGNSAIGLKSAAHYYFGKSVSQLTFKEQALLVLTLKNPYEFNPHMRLSKPIKSRIGDLRSRLRRCDRGCRALLQVGGISL